MFKQARFTLLVLASVLALGCRSGLFPGPTVAATDPAAQKLLLRAAAAHGLASYRAHRDIAVRYSGQWLSFVHKVQPVLVDRGHRKTSEERLLPREGIVAQSHQGPLGRKQVVRTADGIQVWYDGAEATDPEVRAAAAIVADSYRMFLTGPFFFLDRGALVLLAGHDTVDGAPCDRLLAVLRPGLGQAAEDRVYLSLDRQSGLLRRVRFTLNGLASTQGAEVDVTLRQQRDIGGVVWPTEFYERVRKPLPLRAHHWFLQGLDLDRGVVAADLTGPAFGGAATEPAHVLPARPR